MIGGSGLAVLLLLGGGFGAWRWVAGQVFVGAEAGSVAVFNGLPQDLGPFALSRVRTVADDVKLADLPDYARDRLVEGISVTSLAKADQIVDSYRDLALRCQALRESAAAPTPTPTPSGSASGTPSGSSSAAASAGASPPLPSPVATTLGASPTSVPTAGPGPTPAPGSDLDCGDLIP